MDKIKMVAFDLDGTLVDAYPAIVESVNHALMTLGLVQQSVDVIRRAVGHGDLELLKAFLPAKDDGQEAVRIYRNHHPEALRRGASFLPGGKELLEHLSRQGYILAIATNRPSPFTHVILEHLKMESYFETVLCADQVARPKPAADILTTLMHRHDVTPDEMLYVGDMTVDARAGRAAGVRTVIVTTGSSSREEIQQEFPYRMVDGLGEVEVILK